jgi:mannosyltransferase OCH1-like enzyme
MIPRIIHQSWKTSEVPEKWRPFQKSWKLLHPSYEYKYWTDENNRDFILRYYPDYLCIYDGYSVSIKRAELARYLILYHFGGIYVDLDFEALRPIDNLLVDEELLFGLEPASHAARPGVRERGLEHIVCNAFMASVPRHQFWDHFFVCLRASKDESNVLEATGTFLLTRACDSHSFVTNITLVPAAQLYPIDNREVRTLDVETMRANLGSAYAVHHWTGSWWRESLLVRARERIALAQRTPANADD